MEKVEVICFGEILWDRMENHNSLGGAPLNVCYHLSRLGIKATLVSQIGDDAHGKAMVDELDRLGLDGALCSVSRTKPTSMVEVHFGEDDAVFYTIPEDVAWDHIPWGRSLDRLTDNAGVLIYGSLAARSMTSRNTLFTLLEKGMCNVFDVNLRFPHFEEETILALMGHANIIKLNGDELKQISHWLKGEYDDVGSAIQAIEEAFPGIEEIVLTLGSEGAYHIEKGSWLKVLPHKVVVEDTVGSGDSFLAAFIGSKLKGDSNERALEKASLLSAYVAGCKGACPEYNWEDIESRTWLRPLKENIN